MRTTSIISSALDRSRRHRRLIEVCVRVGEHEVDSLQASDPETLRSALRPIYAHLPARDATVRFVAVEEDSLPLGLRRRRSATRLPSYHLAINYLTGRQPIVIPHEASRRSQRTLAGAGTADRRA
jgi:hypothetical protein